MSLYIYIYIYICIAIHCFRYFLMCRLPGHRVLRYVVKVGGVHERLRMCVYVFIIIFMVVLFICLFYMLCYDYVLFLFISFPRA